MRVPSPLVIRRTRSFHPCASGVTACSQRVRGLLPSHSVEPLQELAAAAIGQPSLTCLHNKRSPSVVQRIISVSGSSQEEVAFLEKTSGCPLPEIGLYRRCSLLVGDPSLRGKNCASDLLSRARHPDCSLSRLAPISLTFRSNINRLSMRQERL
jgi:hypothetical protein